jgi:ABC-type antimicrobial peptide transport system permease subunit
MYFPYSQLADKYLPGGISGGATVVVRTRTAPLGFLGAIQQQASQLDGGEAIFDSRTMDGLVDKWLGTRRFTMVLLGVFAGLALVLSAIGIYGVISYMIEQRTHEIGIRMALGAKKRDILQLVLGYGGGLTLVGVVLGGVSALLLSRLMESLLYGISSSDPYTFTAVVIVLLLVAFIACYVPARRAMATDPLEVLHHE